MRLSQKNQYNQNENKKEEEYEKERIGEDLTDLPTLKLREAREKRD
jgi:hypothetical protein